MTQRSPGGECHSRIQAQSRNPQRTETEGAPGHDPLDGLARSVHGNQMTGVGKQAGQSGVGRVILVLQDDCVTIAPLTTTCLYSLIYRTRLCLFSSSLLSVLCLLCLVGAQKHAGFVQWSQEELVYILVFAIC